LDRTRANVLNAMAEQDTVVPRAAAQPIGELVGQPGHRQELLLPGGHVTFGTGRSAFKHTLPQLAQWTGAHSDERNR
jgi:polyhydroxyalkanoate synthase